MKFLPLLGANKWKQKHIKMSLNEWNIRINGFKKKKEWERTVAPKTDLKKKKKILFMSPLIQML